MVSKSPNHLKILHWPAHYPDPDYGLPYHLIFIQEHIRSASLYHDNIVLHLSQPPELKALTHISRIVKEGVREIRIRSRRLKSHEANRLHTYYLVARELFRLLLSSSWPDVIHIHIFSQARLPLAIASLFRIPVVVTEHWTALCLEGGLPASRLKFAKYVYEQARVVLPVCEHLERCMRRTGANFKSRIVLNAVDTSIFYWEPLVKRNVEQQRILTVARLDEAKDIPTLFKALEKLKSLGKRIFLDLVGTGDQQALKILAENLGIIEVVRFHGGQPKPVIAKLMRSADVFALPSLWENSPCVIGEALCCGLPVVATAVGGVPELLPPNAGKLIPPSDPVVLASAIAEVLENTQTYNRSDIAIAAQMRFSYQAIGKQIDEIYREVVDKPRVSNPAKYKVKVQ